MIDDGDIQRLFQDMFTARRAVAQRQEDARVAKAVAALAESDLEAAQQRLTDIESHMQRLAERAAGVIPRDLDHEPAPQLHSEFRPIHQR